MKTIGRIENFQLSNKFSIILMQLDVSLANIWQSFGVWATNFSVFVMLPTNIFDNDFRKIIHRKTFFLLRCNIVSSISVLTTKLSRSGHKITKLSINAANIQKEFEFFLNIQQIRWLDVSLSFRQLWILRAVYRK